MPTGTYPRRARGRYKIPRHAVTQPSDPSYRLISLTHNQNAIVDTEDFDWLSQWNWFAQWNRDTRSFYARSNISGKIIPMHRLILGCSEKETGDHKNRNTLDNRRDNLRKCNVTQNCQNATRRKDNSSGFKGVIPMTWKNKTKATTFRWIASIRSNGERIHLGCFTTPEEAAKAYDMAARKYHGEFAVLNFPNL